MQSPLRTGFLSVAAMLFALGAHGQNEPSVLVTLTALHEGSLPQVVTAYGRVQAGALASQTVTAPSWRAWTCARARPLRRTPRSLA